MIPIKCSISLSIIILAAISILGCSSIKKDWISANEKQTLEGYHKFREKHPNSIYDYSALKRIERVEWETVKQQDTVNAYQSFIKKYGTDGQYYKKAFEAMDNKDWEQVKKADTIQAYEKHLTRFKHSHGFHFHHAKERIEEIHWMAALNKKSDSAFINYLTQYKQDKARHYDEALTKLLGLKPISQLKFKIANTFSELPTQKIEAHVKREFADALKNAGIFQPETDGLILDFDIKVSSGNWYTKVQFGTDILSQGVYVKTIARLITHSEKELAKIEHAEGWAYRTSDQWMCAKKSIDLHVGLLLSYFARYDINPADITRVFINNFYFPHRREEGNLRNCCSLKSELIKIGPPAIPAMIEMVSDIEGKNHSNRQRVFHALIEFDDERVTDTLRLLLTDRDPYIKLRAARALEEIKSSRANKKK